MRAEGQGGEQVVPFNTEPGKIVPLLGPSLDTENDKRELRERLQANPMYEGLLISRDESSALFDITLKSDITDAERSRTIQSVEKILLSVVSMLAGNTVQDIYIQYEYHIVRICYMGSKGETI